MGRRIEGSVQRPYRHGTRLRDRRTIGASFLMVNAARGLGALRDALTLCTMAHQDAPRRHGKEECPSASSIKGHQRIQPVASAPHIRAHGRNILRQLVPLQRLTSMPIMPRRSFVPCAASGPPCEDSPLGMPKQPEDCSGCYGCTGWGTIFCGSIVPSEQFPQALWASSRGGCLCRKFSRFTWHK